MTLFIIFKFLVFSERQLIESQVLNGGAAHGVSLMDLGHYVDNSSTVHGSVSIHGKEFSLTFSCKTYLKLDVCQLIYFL